MKANKRAAVKAQTMKVKTPRASKPAPSTKPPAGVPGNQQAPASPGQLSQALAYYGAMAPHGKG